MKLYNWQFAPNCRRVRMFVLEKGLDLPAIEEVIGDRLRLVPGYIETWPHAMVPMLELGRMGPGSARPWRFAATSRTRIPIPT